MRDRGGALTVLRTCMGVKRDERVLVVFDRGHEGPAEEFRRGANAIGARCVAVRESGRREPSRRASGMMDESDAVLFIVEESKTLLYGHSDARARSCDRGARIGFLTQGVGSIPDPAELRRISERTTRVADALSASKSVLIRSGGGRCELKARLGRRAFALSSIITEPGSWGAVPDYAEAAVAPFEAESEGELSVDGTVVGMGVAHVPVVLRFASGRLESASGGTFARRIAEKSHADDGASTLCELGFGTNHLRRELLGEFDDKKMLGSVHVGIGDNHTIGGTSRSGVHLDCLATSVEVELDGRAVDLRSI